MLFFKKASIVVCLMSLTGCASVDVGNGFDEVSALVVERGGVDLHAIASKDPSGNVTIEKHPTPVGAISLDRALHIALTNNPTLQAEYARLAISRADVLQAGLLQNPTLDTTIGVGLTPDPSRFAIGAVYPVLDLVYRKPRIKAAREDFRATQIEVAESVIEHANEVTNAYLELAQAKARLRARQEIIDVARTQLKVIKRLEATGTIDSTDLTEIQATLSEARIEHAAEAGERDTARIRLAGLIGAPVSAKLDTTLAIETISSNLESQSGLVLRAHRQRLDLISAKQEIEVRKIALKKAKRLFDEDGKELGLEFEDEGEEGFLGPSLSVSVPVFDRGQHRKAKAKAELVEAERRFEALKHAIQTDVSEAHKRVATRRATALAHQNTLIPSTIDRAALAREQFNTGSIEAADFLEAQLAISEARLEAIDAAADYWEARVDLSQAVGGWPAKL